MGKYIKSEAIEPLRNAKKVTVLTGAGISAESGIPTFRGKDGIWNKLSPDELASFNAFMKNPDIVTEWYHVRCEIIEKTEPNPAHLALAELEELFPQFNVITQNIDGLHQRAGSKNITEIHGNIMKNYCMECSKKYNHEEFDEIYNNSPDHISRCSCGGLIRPDVIWFGEQLHPENIEKAVESSIDCDVFFAIGTSGLVRPAADLPIYALRYGAYVIEVNRDVTPLTQQAQFILHGEAGETLPKFVSEVKDLLAR